MRIYFTYSGRKFKDDDGKIWIVKYIDMENIDYAVVHLENDIDENALNKTWYYYTESLNEMLHSNDLEPV